MTQLLENKNIKDMIYIIRGQQVMLDADLATLYGYSVKALNQQVKNNLERFPDDFMFQLTIDETNVISRSKNLTLNGQGKNAKYADMLFLNKVFIC